jgi:hypothetical protein
MTFYDPGIHNLFFNTCKLHGRRQCHVTADVDFAQTQVAAESSSEIWARGVQRLSKAADAKDVWEPVQQRGDRVWVA